MPFGPVLSQTYNLIKEGVEPTRRSFFVDHIVECGNKEVCIAADPGVDLLSDAEEGLLKEVFREHGEKSRWDLVEFTHGYPEWKDPQGSAFPIEFEDILKEDKTEDEAQEIADNIRGLRCLDELFVC
jgi:hypothetical protein